MVVDFSFRAIFEEVLRLQHGRFLRPNGLPKGLTRFQQPEKISAKMKA
jgi:hypothetical protein